jgi:hypothetical protein
MREATKASEGYSRYASVRTGENSLNHFSWNRLTRGPSTALSSLRDGNFAQDDSAHALRE